MIWISKVEIKVQRLESVNGFSIVNLQNKQFYNNKSDVLFVTFNNKLFIYCSTQYCSFRINLIIDLIGLLIIMPYLCCSYFKVNLFRIVGLQYIWHLFVPLPAPVIPLIYHSPFIGQVKSRHTPTVCNVLAESKRL